MADSKKHRRISPRSQLVIGALSVLAVVLAISLVTGSGFLAATNTNPISEVIGALSYSPASFTVAQTDIVTLQPTITVSGPVNLTSVQLSVVYSTTRLQLTQATPASSWQTSSLDSSSTGSTWILTPESGSSVAVQNSTNFGNLTFKGLQTGSVTITFDTSQSRVIGQIDQGSPAALSLTTSGATGSVTTSTTTSPSPTPQPPSPIPTPDNGSGSGSSSGSSGSASSGSTGPAPTTSPNQTTPTPSAGTTASAGSIRILPGYTIGLTAVQPPLVGTTSAIFYFLFLESTKVTISYGTDKTMAQSVETPKAGLAFNLKLSNLLENTTYYYRVQLANAQGTSEQVGQLKTFSSLTASTSGTVAIDQTKVAVVMPDDLPGTAQISIVLKDKDGRAVTHQRLHLQLDQPDLASATAVEELDGIYQTTITVANPQSQTVGFSILGADNQPVASKQTIVFSAKQSSTLTQLSLTNLRNNPIVRNSLLGGILALLLLGWLFWRLSRAK